MRATSFLMFSGRAEEAMNLYAATLPHARIVEIDRYGEHEAGKPGTVKRAVLEICGTRYICIDSSVEHAFGFTPAMSIFVDFDDHPTFDRAFAALAGGGQILMPPDEYGFSSMFAWVNDRYGVSWQLNMPWRADLPTWAEFEHAAPDLAEAGRRLLPEVAFLATVSHDGHLRVHPVCPAFAAGRLWAFVLHDSPKRHDLDYNQRYALHAMLGAEDEEFFVTGEASRVVDPDLREAAAAAMPYMDVDDSHVLYEFGIERVLWTTWEQFQQPDMRPQHRAWISPAVSAGSPRS